MTDHDEELDEFTRHALRQLDPPPPTPRDEIWARIEAARMSSGVVPLTGTGVARSGDASRFGSPRRTAWVQWGAALAAMLVLGIGLGRVSVRDTIAPEPSDAVATTGTPVTDNASTDNMVTRPALTGSSGPGAIDPASDVPAAYQVATSQHLQRTEALFTSLAIDVETRGTAEVSGWARELLTDTRLLLGSPAAADAETLRLLEELELVLAQIAAIPSARASEEVELIEDAINQSDVLLRMRAATTGRRLVGT